MFRLVAAMVLLAACLAAARHFAGSSAPEPHFHFVGPARLANSSDSGERLATP